MLKSNKGGAVFDGHQDLTVDSTDRRTRATANGAGGGALLYGRKRNGDRKEGRDKDKSPMRLTPVNGKDGFYWELGIEATKGMQDMKIGDGKGEMK